ncbi:MAG TPA: cytochrome c [Polyangiaceae bacterium]|jgi:mono/diheme cytochrome c family protein|nr:cytochrome c [Polyangiaceae bacterium]
MIPSFAGSRILGSLLGVAVLFGSSIALVACEEEPFSKSMTLGGKQVSAETLNAGREAYMHYCRACHGDKGDGKGPAALGLRPPPRDFTQGKFKFAAVESGSLPNDEDFRRIVKKGLHGTAMLEWDVPDGELTGIIQYIKTLSPKWLKEKPGTPIVPPPDPWNGQEQAAIQRGKELYHVTTQCAGCHPNYATRDDIASVTMRLKKFQVTNFRDDMYGAILKESEYRTTLAPAEEPPATAHAKHEAEGHGAKANPAHDEGHLAKPAAKTEAKPNYYFVNILPPDFTRSPLRSGTELEDLFRTIAAGVGGTAMPSWKATAAYTDPNTGEKWDGDKDIWALAHYVKSLVKLNGTREADTLRDKLARQPAYAPPPPAPLEPAAGGPSSPAGSANPATSSAPLPTAPPPASPKAIPKLPAPATSH